jgi:hypothetical protein
VMLGRRIVGDYVIGIVANDVIVIIGGSSHTTFAYGWGATWP